MSQPRAFQTRPQTLDDIPALARLMAEVYGPTHRTADERHLRWQYAENPLGEACGAVAVAAGGEVVGSYSLIPIPLSVNGRDVPAMLSLNTATSPRFQGQGIFTAIAKETYAMAAARGAAGVLGFPNENSLPGFVKKLSFSLVGRMAAFARPRRLGALLARGRSARLVDRALDVASTFAFRLLGRGRGLPVPVAVDHTLADGLSPSPSLALSRRLDWLRWRYEQSPLFRYEVLASPDGRARVACRHDDLWGVPTTLLLELSAPFGQPGASRSLAAAIRAACRRADEEDSAQVMTLVSPGHPAVPALYLAGLVRVPDRLLPHPAHVIYRPLGSAPPPGDFATWAVTVGAYDAG